MHDPYPSDHLDEQPPAAPALAPETGVLRNIGFLIGTLIIVGSVVALSVSAFDEQIYYFTVAEAEQNRASIGDTEFRIKGNVVADSLQLREGVLNEHRFTLQSDGVEVIVDYTGPLPDTFSDDAEVIALGSFPADSMTGHFVAIEVIAKCPSRYEEQAPTAASQQASR